MNVLLASEVTQSAWAQGWLMLLFAEPERVHMMQRFNWSTPNSLTRSRIHRRGRAQPCYITTRSCMYANASNSTNLQTTARASLKSLHAALFAAQSDINPGPFVKPGQFPRFEREVVVAPALLAGPAALEPVAANAAGAVAVVNEVSSGEFLQADSIHSGRKH